MERKNSNTLFMTNEYLTFIEDILTICLTFSRLLSDNNIVSQLNNLASY